MNLADQLKARIKRNTALEFLRNKSLSDLEGDVRAILQDLPTGHLVALERLVQEELNNPGRRGET